MVKYIGTEKTLLLKIASDAIAFGLANKKEITLDLSEYSSHLKEERASFVTLHLYQQLRGCIGSLQAQQPLVQDVAYNAYAAAFLDPRFNPLTLAEFADIHIHISVLNKPERLEFSSEEDLIRQLRPGIDGLIMVEKGLKGTFLPSVWESTPESSLFLEHLKMKTGLPPNYWSKTIKIQRYTIESIE